MERGKWESKIKLKKLWSRERKESRYTMAKQVCCPSALSHQPYSGYDYSCSFSFLFPFPIPYTHTHTHSFTHSLSLSLSLSLSASFSALFLGTHLAKFTIRHVAMELYYASSFYYTLFQRYTDSIVTLAAWAPENVLLGNCTKIPVIDVSLDGESYVAYVGNLANTRVAVVRSDRHLIVRSVWAWSLRNGEKRGLREIVPVCAHMRMSLW